MVTCKQCQTDFDFKKLQPEIDEVDLHFYFRCPDCGHKNTLINVAKPGRPLLLTQFDG